MQGVASSNSVLLVGVYALFQQVFQHFDFPGTNRRSYSVGTESGDNMRVSSVVQQKFHHREMSGHGCIEQRRESSVVAGVGVSFFS